MIHAFLIKKLLGIPRWLWVVLVLIAIIGIALVWADAVEKADDKANQEIGAQGVVVEQQREVLERTEQGNAAREAIEQSGPVGDQLRYDQCMRSARTPTNCQRFLPQRQADQL